MSFTRSTSLYTIVMDRSDLYTLTEMIARLTVELQGSGYRCNGREAYVQFRAGGDGEALRVAETVAGGAEFKLRTGLGAHQRFISPALASDWE